MSALRLWFVNKEQPQLEKVCFSHPLLSREQDSYRGKNSGAYSSSYSFQWSSAVRALSLLFLLNVSWRRRCSGADMESAPLLIGAESSAASSLDYALGKLPLWLLDMFGVDSHGNPLARRLLRRSNPERRRGGECAVGINFSMLSAENIFVYLDGKSVDDDAEIGDLVNGVKKGLDEKGIRNIEVADSFLRQSTELKGENNSDEVCCGDQERTALVANLKERALSLGGSAAAEAVNRFISRQVQMPLPHPFNRIARFNWWRRTVRTDLDQVLSDTGIFNRQLYRQEIKRICGDKTFLNLSGGKCMPTSEVDLNMPFSARLGVQSDLTSGRELLEKLYPLRVALPVDQGGTLAIFNYMKYICAYKIDIDYRHLASSEMINGCSGNGLASQFDICVMSLAAAASVMANKSKSLFAPLMLMPKTTRRVVVSERFKAGKDDLRKGQFVFMKNVPSAGSMYFNRMVEQGWLDCGKIKSLDMELDEMSEALRQGERDLRAIIWYPFYWFSQAFDNCSFIDERTCHLGALESVMMVRKSVLDDPSAAQVLAGAVRHAWMALREQPAAVDLVTELMIQDRHHLNLLKRASGFTAEPRSFSGQLN